MLAQILEVLQNLLMPLLIGAVVVGAVAVYFVGRKPADTPKAPAPQRPVAPPAATTTRPAAEELPHQAPTPPAAAPRTAAPRTAAPRPPAPATPPAVQPTARAAPPVPADARAAPVALQPAPVDERPPAAPVVAPVAAPAAPAAAVVAPATPPAAPPSPAPVLPWAADLLLVDDSAVVRAKLRKLFEPAGYQVVLARDGAEALALLGQQRYSLMVTDLEMPNIDGEALIKATLLNPATAGMPILAITGHEDLQERLNQLHAISGIYRKPWVDDDLLSHVQSLVTAKRLASIDSESD